MRVMLQHSHVMRRPRLLRRARCLCSALAVFVAVVTRVQVFVSPSMCGPNIRTSSQSVMFGTNVLQPHDKLGWRCTRRAAGDIVQVLFDNSWIDATVDSEATANIKVSFEVEGYKYGMVTKMWRKVIKSGVEGPPRIKPVVEKPPKTRPVAETPPWIKHPMKNLKRGQKLEAVVINNTQHSGFVNISSEFPGILVYSTMPAIKGFKMLTAGAKIDVWVAEDPNKTFQAKSNGTVPLTVMDYTSIEKGISAAAWIDATVSGFNSEEDVFVSVPIQNRAGGLTLSGIVPWEDRKQDLDTGPVPKLEVEQQVKVRVIDVSRATGKVSFSMIPRKDPQEFVQLINTDTWLDGEVVKAGSFGLVVKVAHPKSGQLATGLVTMNQWRPTSPCFDDMLQQKVRIRVIGNDEKNKGFLGSMLPKSDILEFTRAPPDLFLNATVTGIMDFGMLVLADPPWGSSTGPYTILIPPDQIPESASGTGYTAFESNDMIGESDAAVANIVTFHTDPVASQSSASSTPAEPAAQMRFSVGDNVKVRIVKLGRQKRLVGSLKELPNVAAFANMTETDWLDAIVTGYSKIGVGVNVTPTNGGPPEPGIIRSDEICMGFCTDPSTEVSIGEKLQVRVVSADQTGFYLSMLPKQEVNGWSKGSKVFYGIVTDVGEVGALVIVRPFDGGLPVQGMLPAEAIFLEDKTQEVSLGQQLAVRVKRVNAQTGKIELSMATDKDIGSATATSASLQAASQSNGMGQASKSIQLEDSSWVDNVAPDEEMTGQFISETKFGLFLGIQEHTQDGSGGRVSRGLLHISEMNGTIEEVAELAKSNQLKVRIKKGKAGKSQKLQLTMKA